MIWTIQPALKRPRALATVTVRPIRTVSTISPSFDARIVKVMQIIPVLQMMVAVRNTYPRPSNHSCRQLRNDSGAKNVWRRGGTWGSEDILCRDSDRQIDPREAT